MKKAIIAMAVALVGASLQAATANWGAPFVFNSNQTMETVGAVDYQWAIVELASADVSGISFANGTLTGATAFAGGKATDVINVSPMGQELAGVLSGATAGKYYSLVIWQADEKLWGISDAALATANPTDATGNTLMDLQFTNGNDPFGVGVPSMTASQAVPEPTSGLLLLLGMAGLALRRKQA